MSDEITHLIRSGSGVVACCGKTLFELPTTDLVSTDDLAVTCPLTAYDVEPVLVSVTQGAVLCGYGYPEGALCKVPAAIRHQHVLAYDYDAVEGDQAKRDLVRDWDVDGSIGDSRRRLADEQAAKAKAVTDERFHGGSRLD